MTNFGATQLSLIAESDFSYSPVGDWEYDQLGTDKLLVPNSHNQKLGTDKLLVPNSHNQKLGTEIIPVPNFYEPPREIPRWDSPTLENWKPPIGGLDRKWVKNHQYWCWRYYDKSGKKRSIHLHKDYNKAVRKAIKIGVPSDARLPNLSPTDSQNQAASERTDNLIDIAPTAHPAQRAA